VTFPNESKTHKYLKWYKGGQKKAFSKPLTEIIISVVLVVQQKLNIIKPVIKLPLQMLLISSSPLSQPGGGSSSSFLYTYIILSVYSCTHYTTTCRKFWSPPVPSSPADSQHIFSLHPTAASPCLARSQQRNYPAVSLYSDRGRRRWLPVRMLRRLRMPVWQRWALTYLLSFTSLVELHWRIEKYLSSFPK